MDTLAAALIGVESPETTLGKSNSPELQVARGKLALDERAAATNVHVEARDLERQFGSICRVGSSIKVPIAPEHRLKRHGVALHGGALWRAARYAAASPGDPWQESSLQKAPRPSCPFYLRSAMPFSEPRLPLLGLQQHGWKTFQQRLPCAAAVETTGQTVKEEIQSALIETSFLETNDLAVSSPTSYCSGSQLPLHCLHLQVFVSNNESESTTLNCWWKCSSA